MKTLLFILLVGASIAGLISKSGSDGDHPITAGIKRLHESRAQMAYAHSGGEFTLGNITTIHQHIDYLHGLVPSSCQDGKSLLSAAHSTYKRNEVDLSVNNQLTAQIKQTCRR